jgi:hypothetical protein
VSTPILASRTGPDRVMSVLASAAVSPLAQSHLKPGKNAYSCVCAGSRESHAHDRATSEPCFNLCFWLSSS